MLARLPKPIVIVMAVLAVWFVLPIVLRYIPPRLGIPIQAATVEHIQFMIIGAMIVFFLIVEHTIGNRVIAEVEWSGLDALEMGSEAYPTV